MQTLYSLLKLQQLWLATQEYREAINQNKPLLEVSHTDYSEDTDEPNSALQLEVFKTTNTTGTTDTTVGAKLA